MAIYIVEKSHKVLITLAIYADDTTLCICKENNNKITWTRNLVLSYMFTILTLLRYVM